MSDNKDNCPHCNASLIGDLIPEDVRHHYSPPYRWRREIGIEYPERYDGVWEWQCPDCKGVWPAVAIVFHSAGSFQETPTSTVVIKNDPTNNN